jgi:antitoxin YefM
MTHNTNIKQAKRKFNKLVEMVVENDTVININTKKGNVILIAETDYKGLLETLYLSSNNKYKQTLIEGINTPYDKTLSEKDLNW